MIVGVDLFCGLGGLTHGLILGGIKVSAGYDLDSECRFPYERNNEGATFYKRDVASLQANDLRVAWGKASHTLLAGCAPCQPFSTYSRKSRKRRSDAKWSLVEEFSRLVKESHPDFVTMENVPQLVDHEVFASFLKKLHGYHVWWQVVDCRDYGVPQTRKRLVLLASRLGPISLIKPPSDKHTESTVRGAIAGLRRLKAGEVDPADALHAACRLSELNLQRIVASKPGGSWRDWSAELLAECHRRASGETYPSVYGRMEWDKPAPTITTQCFGYGNGRFGHPEQHRAITLREAALLQTFPLEYVFLEPHEKVRFAVLGRLIGNAVPVEIGRAVAASIREHLIQLGRKCAAPPAVAI